MATAIDGAKHHFSAPVPKGDKFEVIVTDENGQEVTRKDGFDTAADARAWTRDLTSNAAAATAGTKLAPSRSAVRNDGLTDEEAGQNGKPKRRSSLSL